MSPPVTPPSEPPKAACRRARQSIHRWSELSARRRWRLETHTESCDSCAGELLRTRLLLDQLAAAGEAYKELRYPGARPAWPRRACRGGGPLFFPPSPPSSSPPSSASCWPRRPRPTLGLAPPDSTAAGRLADLDGFFGFPPALAPLLEAWQEGDLAVVHPCGLEHASRSHFDAMHFMEVARSDPPGTRVTGWLGRHLAATAPTVRDAVLRAVGIGAGLPRTLVGAPLALPIQDPEAFDFGGDPATRASRQEALESMYAAVPSPLTAAAEGTFRTLDLLRGIDFAGYRPAGGAVYPEAEFGEALRSTAALIKAEAGVEAVAVDLEGWDTHDFQAPVERGVVM